MRILMSIVLLIFSVTAQAERLKDITNVEGVRSNQLIGYGLIVGLSGTGDKAPFTNQTFANMMSQLPFTPSYRPLPSPDSVLM